MYLLQIAVCRSPIRSPKFRLIRYGKTVLTMTSLFSISIASTKGSCISSDRKWDTLSPAWRLSVVIVIRLLMELSVRWHSGSVLVKLSTYWSRRPYRKTYRKRWNCELTGNLLQVWLQRTSYCIWSVTWRHLVERVTCWSTPVMRFASFLWKNAWPCAICRSKQVRGQEWLLRTRQRLNMFEGNNRHPPIWKQRLLVGVNSRLMLVPCTMRHEFMLLVKFNRK